MPCSDGGPSEIECELECRDLSQMLCWLCERSENGLLAGNAQLWAWWQIHLKEDEARQIREAADRKAKQARKNGLAKLTLAERAALGLNRD